MDGSSMCIAIFTMMLVIEIVVVIAGLRALSLSYERIKRLTSP